MPRAPSIQHVSLQAPSDRTFRLAVVADTHSKPHPATEERLRELAPDAILHAGDIGELAVLDQLSAVAPVHAVRGNIDAPTRAVPDLVSLEIRNGEQLALRLLIVHIAVYGPKLRADVAAVAKREGASLVVCGHSHVPFIGRDRGLTLFNPGSIGPKRFGLPIVLGSLEIEKGRVRLAHIDCETGQAWSPP